MYGNVLINLESGTPEKIEEFNNCKESLAADEEVEVKKNIVLRR